MRQLILAIVLFSPLLSHAQFIRGDKFVGGTLSFISSQSNDPNFNRASNSFLINPSIGFFLNEKVAIGVQLGYSNAYTKYIQPLTEYNSSTFSIGLLARRYFSISEKCFFSINGFLNFQRGTDTYTSGSFETKTQNYQLGLGIQPGLLFLPSPKWGLEARIGTLAYDYLKNLTSDFDQSNFNFSYGSISLGVYYFIRKSK